MFEGVPDQFHQFIASRTSLPLPLSFQPIHGSSVATTNTSTNFTPTFDPYSSTTSHQLQVQPNFLHTLHHVSQPTAKNEDKEQNNMVATMDLEIERERSIHQSVDPWSNDEVLALLRIRSSMENWFPEFTWEHVSRKLAELGFKRSAEKCKEKFEEESRYFNNINYSKNYRFFGELEELYNNGDDTNNNSQSYPQENNLATAGKNKKMDKLASEEEEDKIDHEKNMEEDSRIDQTVGNPTEDNDNNDEGKEIEKSKSKKRKRRHKKFEMFKGFCEDIIRRIMVQQEEMHNKLLEDIAKRDEEKIAREEAWKKQEMERIKKELEIRAQEQALVGDRQAKIINFLKKFSSSSTSSDSIEILGETTTSSSMVIPKNPNKQISKPETPISTTIALGHQTNPVIISKNPSSSSTLSHPPQNSIFLNTQSKPSMPISLWTEIAQRKPSPSNKEDLGKRWPKDEVLALINLRSSFYNNNINEEKETTVKAPLWERISQGMLELGYKRSAKRCKEKWENINKYFKKTKDVNKKRSVDSRTCPYFHQLSTLYNQGSLVITSSDGVQKRSVAASPENHSSDAGGGLISSSQNGSSNSAMHVVEGEKHDLDFEF
ncbi:hypothetical protein JCGZ_23481 [Jatropha curcas]|uniref:Myb-like domain-containing protein n=1 Tax=Jatropha curcas TaxID=180498 RepID=A0A067JLE6_JATCU|nr:trihelix transcription factor GTL2 [Jatropha curcas]KDP23648.1 hypothetical protein JCGZ_23481 [Jatropha curcas]